MHLAKRKVRNKLVQRLVAATGIAITGVAASAGTFQTDFNTPTGIPPEFALFGMPAGTYDHSTGGVGGTGVLKLTEATASHNGGAILAHFDGGATITGFTAEFDLYIGSGNGADGFSFFFGDFADGSHGEEGPGNIEGLTIAFDVYNSGTGAGVPEAPAIDLKWNNVIFSHRLVGAASATTGAQPIGAATTIRTQPTQGGAAVYWPVKIQVDPDGTLDLTYNNVVIFANIPVFRPITEITRSSDIGPRFGFAARTGGSFDAHMVDNLRITTVTGTAGTGQPFLSSLTPASLSSQSAGSPASAVGGAVIRLQDSTHSVNSGSVTMRYNNAVVTPVVTRGKSSPELEADDTTIISYHGANGLLPVGVGTVEVSYATTSTPAVNNTFTYSFVVAAAAQVPASYAVTGVDTDKPGFKARVYQMNRPRSPGDGNVTPVGERQVNRGFIDPTTGEPYPDFSDFSVDPSPLDAEGFYDIEGVLNFEQGGGSAGSINAGSNPSRQDEMFPGLTGLGGLAPDNFAIEFTTFLHLQPGGHRFGIFADDRFRFAFGPSAHAAGIPILAASTGANVETLVDVVIAEEGYYPMRVSMWEGGGGANFEIFYIEPGTSRKILLNDPEVLTAPRAYREATGSRPRISRALPVEGHVGAFPDDDILIEVIDGGIPVIDGSVKLRVQGAEQSITTSREGKVTTVVRAGSLENLLPSGLTTVDLIYDINENGSPVTVTTTYTFTVAPYYNVLSPALRVQASDINMDEGGFNVRYAQMDRLKNAPNDQAGTGRIAGGGQGNQMPNPEIQLNGGQINPTNGLAYPNIANPGPNGNFTDAVDVINMNLVFAAPGTYTSPNSGFMTAAAPPFPLPGGGFAENPVPGLPSPTYNEANGTAAGNINPSNGGLDNYVAEYTTYLDLKKGVHVFAFNSDDGFVATSGPDPRDTLGNLLGFFHGGRGSQGNVLGQEFFPWGQNPPVITPGVESGSSIFSVIVPEDGIYPFRVLYWNGGGGVNAEFWSLERDSGTAVLINDRNAVDADNMPVSNIIPAYRTYTGPARPWTRFSVSPTPWDNRQQQAGPGPLQMVGRTRNNIQSTDIYNYADINPVNTAVGNTAPWADVGIGGIIAGGAPGGVADPSIKLLLNGVEVPATKTVENGSDLRVVYRPNPALPPGSSHTATLVYGGTENSWPFKVQNYTTIDAADKAAGSPDPTARGFSVKIVQATTGQANTAARAEAQLAGNPADVSIPGPDNGRYIVPGIINYSNNNNNNPAAGTGIGNFQDNVYGIGWPFPDYVDEPIPGLPGEGTGAAAARWENFTAEIFAYLEFPAAGYYRFGGNVDDGFAVKVGTPGDSSGTVLFSQDRGGGAADVPFSFVVPEAGLYPIRALWYQGGGGAQFEFFTYDETGTKIPVNDPSNPKAIKAYYAIETSGGPELTITTDGTDITITWPNGTLQGSPVAAGPGVDWQDLESDGNYVTTADGDARYFRVIVR